MSIAQWFGEPVLGDMPPGQAAEKLREFGEEEAAASLEAGLPALRPDVFGPRDWIRNWGLGKGFHSSHAFGFIAPSEPGRGLLPISHVGDIDPLVSSKPPRLTITLDGLCCAQYPGRGSRRILCHFASQNHLKRQVEEVHFHATYRVGDGESASVLNYPIFTGLNVGPGGIRIKTRTVNICNDHDEAVLTAMESDAFRSGLRLSMVAQPALIPFASLALALTRSVARKNRAVAVQDFDLGLDFGGQPTGARLAFGSYVAVQLRESVVGVWRWEDWAYDPTAGQIVSRTDLNRRIPHNYVIIGIKPYVAG